MNMKNYTELVASRIQAIDENKKSVKTVVYYSELSIYEVRSVIKHVTDNMRNSLLFPAVKELEIDGKLVVTMTTNRGQYIASFKKSRNGLYNYPIDGIELYKIDGQIKEYQLETFLKTA